ncbi:MAG: hypothetical protein BWY53_00589 [Parcubacteria group bacterium ADurb.Bin326]|nr:MAG: hypothetical protein BWY53_00589 [Parcubacteria group bacterium ADurb.Bin326]
MPKRKKDPRIKVPRLVRIEKKKKTKKKLEEERITKRSYKKDK